MIRMRCLKVEQTRDLHGSLQIPGSKNSALALVAAAFMSDDPVRLLGIPDISDIRVVCRIGNEMGCTIYRDHTDALIIDPSNLANTNLNKKMSSSFRTAQ